MKYQQKLKDCLLTHPIARVNIIEFLVVVFILNRMEID